MYYNEVASIVEVRQFLNFMREEKLPFSVFLNGSTIAFKTSDAKNYFIAGLETFLSLELAFDILY